MEDICEKLIFDAILSIWRLTSVSLEAQNLVYLVGTTKEAVETGSGFPLFNYLTLKLLPNKLVKGTPGCYNCSWIHIFELSNDMVVVVVISEILKFSVFFDFQIIIHCFYYIYKSSHFK